MKPKLRTAVVVILMLSFTASAQVTQVSNVFKHALASEGLGDLTPDQMRKVEHLLGSMSGAMSKECAEKSDAFDSVAPFFESEGYKLEPVMLGSRNGKDMLVVGRTFQEFTTDIPMSINPFRFRNGTYFVKRSVGSVTSIIVDGQKHNFSYAD
jgi:hypothetical protein